MKNPRQGNPTPVVSLHKSNVHGYFQHRGGRLVWVNDYVNRKNRKQPEASIEQHNVVVGAGKRPASPEPTAQPKKKHELVLPQQAGDINYILVAIMQVVKTINSFENGERARLGAALFICKSIVRDLGYYDESLAATFEPPKVKPTRLGRRAARQTDGMAKSTKRLARRNMRSELKGKIQNLSAVLGDAIL